MSFIYKDIEIYPDGRLDAKNAALYLGLSESTLANMRCKGIGPSYIRRGRIFYYLEALDYWLQKTDKLNLCLQKKIVKKESHKND